MQFLSEQSLRKKTVEWSNVLGIDTRTLPSLSSPALLVIDMQKDFLLPDGLLPVWGGPAIISNVLQLIDFFHSRTQPVIFTRHVYDRPERDGGTTARWWKVGPDSMTLRRGSWHSALHDFFNPGDDCVIDKRRYSAFYCTDLELILRTSRVREVVVCGVCTNICCQATAYDAFYRDLEVFVAIDATGATDEESHLATLKNIALAYGHVATTKQVIQSVSKDEEAANAKV